MPLDTAFAPCLPAEVVAVLLCLLPLYLLLLLVLPAIELEPLADNTGLYSFIFVCEFDFVFDINWFNKAISNAVCCCLLLLTGRSVLAPLPLRLLLVLQVLFLEDCGINRLMILEVVV